MSIVRENLLTRRGYTPYCGNEQCVAGQPRTRFRTSQFACGCGWQTSFEAEFIEKYKAFTASRVDGVSTLKSEN